MSKKKDASPDEVQPEDLSQQVVALNERVKELAGYRQEAVDSRDQIAKLEAQLIAANAERDAALKAEAIAVSDRKSIAALNDSNAEAIEAAKQLAAALKKLS